MTPEQKQERVENAIRHAEQDLLVAGSYLSNGNKKGCSVGCDWIDIQLKSGVSRLDIDEGDCHKGVADYYGTAEWLERLRDRIFEGLAEGRRSWWHIELAKSLPDHNVDWEGVRHQVCIAILRRVLTRENEWPEEVAKSVGDAVRQCISYHEDPSEYKHSAAESAESAAESTAAWSAWSAWSVAWSAAESTAAWSAMSAAWSAAWSARAAAESAAESAESAAESAESAAWSAAESAESAAWSASWSASWSAEYKVLAELIVAVLGECHESTN